MYVPNQDLNKHRDPECFAITPERKYWKSGNTFIKRSLRRSEWQLNPTKGTVHVPKQGIERIFNEAAAVKFVADSTNVPVPKLLCCFEDDGAAYIVMEYIEGVGMDKLNHGQRKIVEEELSTHINTLHKLSSPKLGGPSGLVVPPYRVARQSPRSQWHGKSSPTSSFVFCHNDLSQQNVIVDPESLKIQAIIDWEYSGFYPEYFDRPFFKRLGPSIALDGEEDDAQRLIRFLLDDQE